jgi:hypothetical protein
VRWVPIALGLLLVLPATSIALPNTLIALAHGTVSGDLIAGCGEVEATLEIEGATRLVDAGQTFDGVLYGTGALQLWDASPFCIYFPNWFIGGQGFGMSGNCRILQDTTAECWRASGGSFAEPSGWTEGHRGEYFRLAPDGAFEYHSWYYDHEHMSGTFLRVV